MQDVIKKKAEYRSSIRSKALIRSAMIELLEEKSFFDISITDIVNKANINRGTFYAHFKDTYDVIDRILDSELTMISDEIDRFSAEELINDSKDILVCISDEIVKRERLIKKLVSIGRSDVSCRKLVERCVEILMKICPDDLDDRDRLRFRIKMSFLVDGIFAVYFDSIIGRLDVEVLALPSILTPMVKGNIAKALETAVTE